VTGPRIGIDLGGTKIEGVVLGDRGDVLHRRRIDTPRNDYVATVAAVAEMVSELDASVGKRCSVGIGTPGAWRADTGAMQNCNSTWLNGKPLLHDLIARIGDRVRMANDANCLALSEAHDGAAVGVRCVFAVILGTGVGGGIVVDGRLLEGRNAIGGEWGHTPLPYLRCDDRLPRRIAMLEGQLRSRACYCGRRDCIETYLSGPGLATTHAELWQERLDGTAIAAATSDNARLTIELYVHLLARSLAQVINVLDPDTFVVGGGVSQIGSLYERTPALWQPYVFSAKVTTRIVPAQFGAASGVRGAARLWPD